MLGLVQVRAGEVSLIAVTLCDKFLAVVETTRRRTSKIVSLTGPIELLPLPTPSQSSMG